jgi:hypothetical protein
VCDDIQKTEHSEEFKSGFLHALNTWLDSDKRRFGVLLCEPDGSRQTVFGIGRQER